jgi:hypothetical protein
MGGNWLPALYRNMQQCGARQLQNTVTKYKAVKREQQERKLTKKQEWSCF